MKYYLIAGEPSGDALGGRLMEALKAQDKNAQFFGIGGDIMQTQGMESLFNISELAVMGLAEVIPSIPKILRRIKQTVQNIHIVALLGNFHSSVSGLVVLDAELHLVVVVADGDTQVAFGVLALQSKHVSRYFALLDVVMFLEAIKDREAEAQGSCRGGEPTQRFITHSAIVIVDACCKGG